MAFLQLKSSYFIGVSVRKYTRLIKIGISRCIRVPKPFIEQAHPERKELELQVIKGGLFIVPTLKPREVGQNTLVAQGAEK